MNDSFFIYYRYISQELIYYLQNININCSKLKKKINLMIQDVIKMRNDDLLKFATNLFASSDQCILQRVHRIQ